MNELQIILDKISSLYTKQQRLLISQSGTMNIIDIMNRSHLENENSNVLAYLLDPKEKHHHPEYGKYFIDYLKESRADIKTNEIISIEREKCISEKRRIDILICTSDDVIIIENKIYASDQIEQLQDYILWAKKEYSKLNGKNPVVIYLTINGDMPSEQSLCESDKRELLEQGKLLCLSYKEDILHWLTLLNVRSSNETQLQAAILQYIDLVEGLCQKRKEHMKMNSQITIDLFDKYKDKTRDDIVHDMKLTSLFEQSIGFSLFVFFISDVTAVRLT